MSDTPNLPDLTGRKLLLGVTGSIAAYKSALLVRRLKEAGAEVRVLMTPDAARFITPLTLGTLSEHEVLTDLFPDNEEGSWTKHVELGQWADLFVVAPATAQTIAKLAGGFCSSMLTATALSARCPLLVCPAMDRDMFAHPATQRNLQTLEEDGTQIMAPTRGELASGLVGQGRLPDPEAIVQRVVDLLKAEKREGAGAEASATAHPAAKPDSIANRKSPIENRAVLITAGPTREHLDPVRFLSNPSTGTMGFALAEVAARRGATVTLVAGPTDLDTPPGNVRRIDVETAQEMHDAVQAHASDADLVIMAAAVADYAPTESSEQKIKKQDSSDLSLQLKRTPDILAALGQQKRNGQTLVGFALETHEALDNARQKLQQKNLDWIVLNDLSEEGAGFGTDTNRVTLLGADGTEETLPLQSKRDVAETILEHVTEPQ